MEEALFWMGRFGGSASIFGIVMAGWWNADRFLSKAATERLSGILTRERGSPGDWQSEVEGAREFLRNSIGPQLPIGRFLLSVAASMLVGLTVFLAFYFMLAPAFFQQMLLDGFARQQALRFLAAYGIPVIFLATYLSFFFQGVVLDNLAASSIPSLFGYIAFDVALRLVVFAAVSAGVFWVFARFFGSFGGSTEAALRAVPDTIRGAVGFANLAGVYFYAATLSAFPLFILLAMKATAHSSTLRASWRWVSWLLPIGEKPLRFCVLLVAGVLAICGFCTVAALDAYTYYVG